MEEKRKAEHLLVVYANTGEHIMIEYDCISNERDRLTLARIEKKENGENMKNCIAQFYTRNIAGWEKIR